MNALRVKKPNNPQILCNFHKKNSDDAIVVLLHFDHECCQSNRLEISFKSDPQLLWCHVCLKTVLTGLFI